ncbi:MAG: tetratricopeptide (TPR) repeat protein [Gammaproteobacteria bacterium]|jgi:tetratricopeptide (TPR) repeat protein
MSLLMDALKKAEQDKKDAANKRNLTEDSEIQVQQNSAEATGPNQDLNSTNNSLPVQADLSSDKSSLDLSLEPIEAGLEQGSTEKDDPEKFTLPKPEVEEIMEDSFEDVTQAIEQPITTTGEHKKLEITRELEVAEIPQAPDMNPQQTLHEVDLDKTFSSELYEDTLQGEPFKSEDYHKSYDETLPGVLAAQLAKDIGTPDQPTPVAAQTIFTATNTIAKPSSVLRWLLVTFAIFAVGSAIIVYYYSVIPISRDMPSPLVARGVETIISNAGVNKLAPITVLSQDPSAQTATDGLTPNGDIGSDGITDEETIDESMVTDTVTDIADPEADNQITDTNDLESSIAATQDSFGLGLEDTATLPKVIVPPSSLVKITRSQPRSGDNQLIKEAYIAYRAGEYSRAEAIYLQAEEIIPDNRDVLLGLAAISTRKGDMDTALNLYIQILRQNPLDNIARAAVLGFEYGNSVTESISAIKTMLFDAPDQPLLFFTLGKLNASRASWSEAQQAFFDAYRLDSSNPDFALNLAISLDRLGQTQPALDYYKTAIDLAKITPAGFNTVNIQDRINSLSTGN